MWKPRGIPDDARGCQCPFEWYLHPQGCLRRGVRASGSYPERSGKSGSFGMWHNPRGSSRISSGGRPHPEVRREGREPLPDHAGESPLLSRSGGEKGLRGSGAGTLVFLSGHPGVSGDFWGSQESCKGPCRPSGRNRGLPLRRRRGQGPHLAKRWEPRGFSRGAAGFSSYDGDLSLPLGLALGSPIFPSGCEGKLGVALESLQGRRDLT